MTTNLTAKSLPATSPRAPAAWAWWGVPAALAGLAGNFIAAHDKLSNADAAEAVSSVSRTSYHVSTVLGLTSFICLILVAAGWRRWASDRGLVEQSISTGIVISATLVLFATGLRGALAEYLPGGINEDNFNDAGLYGLFIVHDTAPWTAWWGILFMAAAVGFISLAGQSFPRWLGVLSILALAMPTAVMAGSGALAAAGFVGPIWLAIFSVIVALRGIDRHSARH